MKAYSYCHKCHHGCPMATMEEAVSGDQLCPTCGYENPANATPAEVFEAYRASVEERLSRLEDTIRQLASGRNA